MRSPRLPLAACLSIVATVASGHATDVAIGTDASAGADASHDFDFIFGDWHVRHRRLQPGTDQWVAFDGTSSQRPVLGGSGNVEDNVLHAPAGTYRAVALRAFDPKSQQWAIWWLDGRYPELPLDPPVIGRFVDGVGTFYADYEQDGKPMRLRFVWSHISAQTARWEQATTADDGKTWATNWVMRFRRANADEATAMAAASAAAAKGAPAATHDFDFLFRDWQVAHRFLRVADGKSAWTDAVGTSTTRPLMGGWSNVEDNAITTANGSHRAVALRTYDAKAGQWRIWWLDGRDPHAPLDPPMQGRFENGAGTFHGETTVDGKPLRIRFDWSRPTPATAHWQQAYSADGGNAWEKNWEMTFRAAD